MPASQVDGAGSPGSCERQDCAPGKNAVFVPRTTDSRHLCPIAPNHLAERIEPPTQPNEVWPADITCVAAKEGWRSGAGVLDACSRKIVGRAAADTAAHRPGGACFRACRPDTAAAAGLLHHSDRGRQYASDAYREPLRRHAVIPSMSRAGNCYDNAKMESCWATLKGELVQDRVFASHAEAKSEIFWYIENFHNRTRLHSALGYQSPVDFARHLN